MGSNGRETGSVFWDWYYSVIFFSFILHISATGGTNHNTLPRKGNDS